MTIWGTLGRSHAPAGTRRRGFSVATPSCCPPGLHLVVPLPLQLLNSLWVQAHDTLGWSMGTWHQCEASPGHGVFLSWAIHSDCVVLCVGPQLLLIERSCGCCIKGSLPLLLRQLTFFSIAFFFSSLPALWLLNVTDLSGSQHFPINQGERASFVAEQLTSLLLLLVIPDLPRLRFAWAMAPRWTRLQLPPAEQKGLGIGRGIRIRHWKIRKVKEKHLHCSWQCERLMKAPGLRGHQAHLMPFVFGFGETVFQ